MTPKIFDGKVLESYSSLTIDFKCPSGFVRYGVTGSTVPDDLDHCNVFKNGFAFSNVVSKLLLSLVVDEFMIITMRGYFMPLKRDFFN
jgi:hypothetical protein